MPIPKSTKNAKKACTAGYQLDPRTGICIESKKLNIYGLHNAPYNYNDGNQIMMEGCIQPNGQLGSNCPVGYHEKYYNVGNIETQYGNTSTQCVCEPNAAPRPNQYQDKMKLGGRINSPRLKQNPSGWTGRTPWPCETQHGDCFPTWLGGAGTWEACHDPIGWCSCATNWYDPMSGQSQAFAGHQECCPNSGCVATQQQWYQQCDCYQLYDAQNMGLGWASDCDVYDCFNCGHDGGAEPFWFLTNGDNPSGQWVYDFCWDYGNDIMPCSAQGLLQCPADTPNAGECVVGLADCENDGCPSGFKWCNNGCIPHQERCVPGQESGDKVGGRRGGTARNIVRKKVDNQNNPYSCHCVNNPPNACGYCSGACANQGDTCGPGCGNCSSGMGGGGNPGKPPPHGDGQGPAIRDIPYQSKPTARRGGLTRRRRR